MNLNASPQVSVVIPTYNHAHYLARALQSVLDQSYTSWEVILIDNHSTDNTDEVIQSFTDPRISFLKIHNNGVIAASRNAGIRAAKGEWVAFLDSDDWWERNKLQVCFDSIDETVDFVYHDLGLVREAPQFFGKTTTSSWQVKPPVFMDLMVRGNAIATSSVLVKKRLLDEISGMNESADMVASEDYNAWLKIARLTDRFLYLPKVLGFYTLHSQGVSKKDMSVSARHATNEFVSLLNERQRMKFEAAMRYTKGRFRYLSGEDSDAQDDLLFVLRHGQYRFFFKSLWMIVVIQKSRLFPNASKSVNTCRK